MKHHPLSVPLLLLGALAAQDHVILVGHADNGGPKGPNGNSFPAARVKDDDLDGKIDAATELHAFLTQAYHTGKSFMTDVRWINEGGEYAFYFTDSTGYVVRGADRDHDGVLANSEVTKFKGLGSNFAPDSLAVRWDATAKVTVVYVAMDEAPKGIHRFVDLNNDGDAEDAGESTIFVNAAKGLIVPGKAGPVTLTSDRWTRLRVTPNGKLLAYMAGPASPTGGGGGPQAPDQFAWYAFTDNNGTPSVSLFFNPSTINGLVTHADFTATGKFPIQDIVPVGTNLHPSWCDMSICEIDPFGAFPVHAYYFMTTYRPSGYGDTNLSNQNIRGLVFRFADANFNEVIDSNEIQLYFNFSGSTYASVAPVSYFDPLRNTNLVALDDLPHDLGAAKGVLSLSWENKANDVVIAMTDSNRNGVIESSEITPVWVTPSGPFPFPYHVSFGPYTIGMDALATGALPGPFQPGLRPEGEGCPNMTGLIPVCEAFGGAAKVGNASLQLAVIRAGAGEAGTLMLGAQRVDIDLGPLNMPGCKLLTIPLLVFPTVSTDANGIARLPSPVPNDPTIAGLQVLGQWLLTDRTATGRLPFVTSNALRLTIQP